MQEPVTKLRICQNVTCSAPAPWDYEPDGRWYCEKHIAVRVFNEAFRRGTLSDYGVGYLNGRQTVQEAN